jgi:hypothetical protein
VESYSSKIDVEKRVIDQLAKQIEAMSVKVINLVR